MCSSSSRSAGRDEGGRRAGSAGEGRGGEGGANFSSAQKRLQVSRSASSRNFVGFDGATREAGVARGARRAGTRGARFSTFARVLRASRGAGRTSAGSSVPFSAYTRTDARTAPGAYAKRTRTRCSAFPSLAPAEAGRLTGRAATAPRAAFTLTADDRVAARPRAPARTGTTPAPATVAWEAISERDLTQPLVPRKIFASSALSGTANERASATAPRGFEGTPCTSMLRAREAATLHTNDGSASWGGRWRCVEE